MDYIKALIAIAVVTGLVALGYNILDKHSDQKEYVSEDFKEDTLVTISDIENGLSSVDGYIERWEDEWLDDQLSDRESLIYIEMMLMIEKSEYEKDRDLYHLSKEMVLNRLNPNY